MQFMGQAQTRVNSRIGRILVALAICSLTVSVATRYVDLDTASQLVMSIDNHAPHAKTQHLLSDGANWSAPAPAFTFLAPPQSDTPVVSVDILPTNLVAESWLYNRPPPSL